MAVEERIEPRWWGRHLHELRWHGELARLLVDPVYRGVDVARGDGGPVMLIPGFLAGDGSLSVMPSGCGARATARAGPGSTSTPTAPTGC
jgi:hypothetical protein